MHGLWCKIEETEKNNSGGEGGSTSENHDEKKNGRTDIFLPSNEQEDLKKSIQIMPELYETECYRLSGIRFFG